MLGYSITKLTEQLYYSLSRLLSMVVICYVVCLLYITQFIYCQLTEFELSENVQCKVVTAMH